ncbi:MAG: D-alanine--D-alanine ligase, partial [Myxococcaceae bacterium]|nr:D-alanine--D-alanine ligase [Myxococcaceae bacterium]
GELGLPVFTKPANLGSSVGIRRVGHANELEAAIEHAFTFDGKVVVESGLLRPRELECPILGGDVPRASVVGEVGITHEDGFYSYRAKYLDETGSELSIPAALTDAQAREVQALALATFAALDAEGLARVDFFLDQHGELYVNEINTMPGFTASSMFPKLWEASGVSPRALMNELINDELTRAGRRRSRRTTP